MSRLRVVVVLSLLLLVDCRPLGSGNPQGGAGPVAPPAYAGGGGGPSGAPSGGPRTSGGPRASGGGVEQTCVETINMYRAQLGVPALVRAPAGEACAANAAQLDSRTGRYHGQFGQCQETGQNECWESSSNHMIERCLRWMWNEGPGGSHYDNMANRKYTQVSCGFFRTAGGDLWSVQNFR